MTGDKVRPAEAGEDDRDDDPEADHAHDDARPLGHGQVQLAPPGLLYKCRVAVAHLILTYLLTVTQY